MKTFLHVGCGPVRFDPTTQLSYRPQGFDALDWNELRLDINPQVQPDFVGSMTDMSAVETESIDAIFHHTTSSICIRMKSPSPWPSSSEF